MVVARRNVGRQRTERVERRFVTLLQLLFHIDLDHVHRHVTGAFDHDLDVVLPGDLRELAQRFEFGKLAFVVRVGNGAGSQSVAQAERDVVRLHDLADLFEVGIGEVLLMMSQTPLGVDRSAARDNTGHPLRRHRHIRQTHAGVNGEIVDALLSLLDERVAENLPGQVFRLAADLFERLIDRHGADRHRGIANDPFASLVDVLAGGEVHHRVGAPADRPDHLFNFFFD